MGLLNKLKGKIDAMVERLDIPQIESSDISTVGMDTDELLALAQKRRMTATTEEAKEQSSSADDVFEPTDLVYNSNVRDTCDVAKEIVDDKESVQNRDKDVTCIDFGDWVDIHALPQQQQRIASAKKAACTPVSLNASKYEGTFSGEHGIYSTTLRECQCMDFFYRRLPCKHMYRLAMECGVFDGGELESDVKAIVKPGSAAKRKLQAFREIVAVLETYDEDVQNIIREMIGHYDERNLYPCDNIIPFGDAIRRGYIEVVKDDKKAIQLHTQKYTIEKLEESGFVFPEDLKKTKKARYEWCLSHPDIVGNIVYADFAFLYISGPLKISEKRIYTYLQRKFSDKVLRLRGGKEYRIPFESEYSISVIGDGKAVLHTEFPHDEITEALDQYGSNRCSDIIINSFDGRIPYLDQSNCKKPEGTLGCFLNYYDYIVYGINKEGEKQFINCTGANEVVAISKAKKEGLCAPFEVSVSEFSLPTEYQLECLKKNGIDIPVGITRVDAWHMIGRMFERVCELPPEWLVSLANSLNIGFSAFVSEKELFNDVILNSCFVDRAALYVYAVQQDFNGKPFRNMFEDSNLNYFYQFSSKIVSDSALIRSLKNRVVDDYKKPHKGSAIYKSAIAFLKDNEILD